MSLVSEFFETARGARLQQYNPHSQAKDITRAIIHVEKHLTAKVAGLYLGAAARQVVEPETSAFSGSWDRFYQDQSGEQYSPTDPEDGDELSPVVR